MDKEIYFSTKLDTTLLIRNPRNSKTLTFNIKSLKLDGDSVTSFDILLEKQASIIEVQK